MSSVLHRRSLITFALAPLIWAAVAAAQPTPPVRQPDAQPQPDAQARQQVSQALRLLEQNQPGEARELLQRTAKQTDDPAMRYVAGLIAGQIAGDFADRQRVWREAKVVDAVVLVPDRRSFYAAIERWGDGPRFPVLIEDGWWSPMFIRAFQPARVVRWSAPKPDAPQGDATAAGAALESLIKAHDDQLDRAADDAPLPPGIVVIDPDHAQAPAAAALALGRGQRAMLYEPPPANELNNPDNVAKVNQAVMARAYKQGLLRADSWFAITLAGDYPRKAMLDGKPVALDDLLGRDARGLRHAVAARLHGSTEQAIYLAMCSMFLHPQRTLLVDDYANREGGTFVAYRFDEAAKVLGRDMDVTQLTNQDASAARLRELRRTADPFDMVWINSSGNAGDFELRGPRGRPDDLPIGHPAAYYVVHSYSATKPRDPDTLAGRALHNGGYWYFGSIHEPYLHAFVQPTGLAIKATAGTPLAFAARHTLVHPMHKPWKLMIVGDPLFTLRDEPAQRVDQGLPEGGGAVTDDAGDDPQRRFRDALLLGADDVAERAVEALASDADLPPGDLRSAIWLLGRAGRTDVLSEHIDPERAADEPIAAMYLAAGATEWFNAAKDRGALDEAYRALEQMLLFSRDREAITQAVRSLIAEAAKRGKDDIVVRALRQRIGQSPMPDASRKAVEAALPAPEGDG